MTPKITTHHLEKLAYVYLRQSTMAQVLHHSESTERQYDLRNDAQRAGWPLDAIRVFDNDLAQSARYGNAERSAFKNLMADVSVGQVGAIFVLEASRLARSCAEWHVLIEICALTDTLIVDQEGCYSPAIGDPKLP